MLLLLILGLQATPVSITFDDLDVTTFTTKDIIKVITKSWQAHRCKCSLDTVPKPWRLAWLLYVESDTWLCSGIS